MFISSGLDVFYHGWSAVNLTTQVKNPLPARLASTLFDISGLICAKWNFTFFSLLCYCRDHQPFQVLTYLATKRIILMLIWVLQNWSAESPFRYHWSSITIAWLVTLVYLCWRYVISAGKSGLDISQEHGWGDREEADIYGIQHHVWPSRPDPLSLLYSCHIASPGCHYSA
jgi:hypothetical protein